MVILGIIVLIVGYIVPVHLLFTLGIVLVVAGVILELAGTFGHPVGGRRHYF